MGKLDDPEVIITDEDGAIVEGIYEPDLPIPTPPENSSSVIDDELSVPDNNSSGYFDGNRQ